MTSDRSLLPLQSAADELGVHYQTAYRWVRTGRLPAQLVDGRYVVDRTDLDDVIAHRRRPRQPALPNATRIDNAADLMHAALVAGDEAVAGRLARTIVGDGTPLVEFIQRVLVPPLIRIGQAWHDGDLSIWVEHRASAISERMLGDLAPNPRGRRRGTAMVVAVAGDRHSLATTMAVVALRDNNWRVHHLGPTCHLTTSSTSAPTTTSTSR